VRRNTLIYQSLTRFLSTLNIPIVATLRDSQNYVRSAETGYGLAEMKTTQVAEDWADWQSMFEWLESPTYHRAQGAGLSSSAQR
jgi:chromosome partitioning protein